MKIEKLWAGIGRDGKIVSGGHNRQRIYKSTVERAIKEASQDGRILTLVEFTAGETVWKR